MMTRSSHISGQRATGHDDVGHATIHLGQQHRPREPPVELAIRGRLHGRGIWKREINVFWIDFPTLRGTFNNTSTSFGGSASASLTCPAMPPAFNFPAKAQVHPS